MICTRWLYEVLIEFRVPKIGKAPFGLEKPFSLTNKNIEKSKTMGELFFEVLHGKGQALSKKNKTFGLKKRVFA